jgi:glycogen synthase
VSVLPATLRVLHITSQFHHGDERPYSDESAVLWKADAVGGMQLQVYKIAEGLAEHGVRQVVLTRALPWAARHRRMKHIDVLRVWPKRSDVLAAEWWQLARTGFRLLREIDVVHAHSGEDLASIPMAAAVARARQVPLVLTLHSSWRFTFRPPDSRGRIRAKLGALAELLGIRCAAVVCTLTESQRHRVSRTLMNRAVEVVTVPAGVDRIVFALGEKRETPWARLGIAIPPGTRPYVFVGRLVAQKNLRWLLRSFGELAQSGWPETLVVCGDGPQRDELELAVRSEGLAGRVHFVGFVSWEVLRDVLSSSEALVLPSLYEEFGAVVLEAMAVCCPVIAARTGGLAEIIDHGTTGLLFDPDNDAQFVEAVIALKTTADLRRRVVGQAYGTVEQFAFSRIVERYLEVYQRCCGS